jgi:hypothetical protein
LHRPSQRAVIMGEGVREGLREGVASGGFMGCGVVCGMWICVGARIVGDSGLLSWLKG